MVGASPTINVECTRASFVSDVTIPDNNAVPAGQPFTKTWRIKNIGTCPWTVAYRLAFISGDQMGAPSSVLLPANVAPAQTADVSVSLLAPANPGQYQGFWQLVTPEGRIFGVGASGTGNLWVKVRVIGTAPSAAPTTPLILPAVPESTLLAVAQPTGTAPVNTDLAAHACDGLWQSIYGTLPCPGHDGDPRGFVLPIHQPYLEGGSAATLPALLTSPSLLKDGYIRGLYPAYKVAAGDHFQASVGCEFNAVSCSVLFRIGYLDSAGAAHDLSTLGESYDGEYSNLDLDLSQLAGQEVRFLLTVEDLGSSAGDRALWVGPRIVHMSGIPPSSAESSTGTQPAPSDTATASATLPAPPASSTAAPVPTTTAPVGSQNPTPLIPQIIESIISFLRQLLGGK